MSENDIQSGILTRLNAVRTLAVLVMVVGYASTMSLGPGHAEWGRLFGYEPSLYAVQVLFFLSGLLALRSLQRHGSGLAMLASRARRNLPILALVTALVAFVAYPIIAPADAPLSIGDRLGYFAATVSCFDPGRLMPGALDDAHYACLLQGAIWTFRWGAIAYIATAMLWHVGLFRSRWVLRLAAVASILSFGGLHYGVEKGVIANDSLWATLETGLAFAYPFLSGLAVQAWRDELTPSLKPALFLVTAACVNALWLPWTPVIFVATSLALCWLALHVVLHARMRPLEGWPDLALPLFVVNWPLCQIVLWAIPDIGTKTLVAVTVAGSLLIALALRLPQLSRRALSPPPLSHAKTARTP